MSLELVSLTGADDLVEPSALSALSAQYPFVEWAILLFPEREHTPRNPSALWRENFLSLGLPYSAAHLCGSQVFRELLTPGEAQQARIADLSRYRRIQLNINARRPEFTDEEVLAIYRTLHAAGLRLILQYHPASELVIEKFLYDLDEEGMKRVDILFDASRGTGLRPDAWPAPHRFNLFCGYAGGLGPDVLEAELPKIKAAATTRHRRDLPYWIDMESGIRTDNTFDLKKVEQVLAHCHSRDIDHLSRCLLIKTRRRDIPEGLYSMSLTWEEIKSLIQSAMDEGARRNVMTHAVWNTEGGDVPSTARVGSFVDSVAGQGRTPAAVAGRLIEETVELALSGGLSAGHIMGHVADALHNQSLKATEVQSKTVFPSQLVGSREELAEECADVSLVLKDLCHVAHIDLPSEEIAKWNRFTKKEFRIGANGTIYAVKPHIKG